MSLAKDAVILAIVGGAGWMLTHDVDAVVSGLVVVGLVLVAWEPADRGR